MIFDEKDLKMFEDLGSSLEGLMNKLEEQTQKVDSEDKVFILNSIGTMKEKISNGSDLTTEIEKLKAHASNR